MQISVLSTIKIYLKQVLLLALFSFLLTPVKAQDYKLPENYSFSKPDDYHKYEKDVLKAIDWLENTPANITPDKRKGVNAFILKWVSGCPYITISISPKIFKITEKNPDLFMIFIGGWIKYELANQGMSNTLDGNIAGLKNMLGYYQKEKDKSLVKDKRIEKLLNLDTDGKLQSWVKKQLL